MYSLVSGNSNEFDIRCVSAILNAEAWTLFRIMAATVNYIFNVLWNVAVKSKLLEDGVGGINCRTNCRRERSAGAWAGGSAGQPRVTCRRMYEKPSAGAHGIRPTGIPTI